MRTRCCKFATSSSDLCRPHHRHGSMETPATTDYREAAMHMLCSKCGKSMWMGFSRPTNDVYCASCGKLLIRGSAATPGHAQAHPRTGIPESRVPGKDSE